VKRCLITSPETKDPDVPESTFGGMDIDSTRRQCIRHAWAVTIPGDCEQILVIAEQRLDNGDCLFTISKVRDIACYQYKICFL